MSKKREQKPLLSFFKNHQKKYLHNFLEIGKRREFLKLYKDNRMTKIEKYNSQSQEVITSPALEEIRVTPMELAEKLIQNPVFELDADKKLVIYNIDSNDFVSAISAIDQPKRLQIFYNIMNKFSLNITLEGSITLGEFDVGSHSWAISAGNSGSLKMTTQPSPLVKSITEIVSFLNLVSAGKGFPLKARQDLLITGLSSSAMLNYHRLCQETEDLVAREKGQDELFRFASELLTLKGLNLKVYGLNASQVNRNIDINAGGILFKAMQLDDGSQPHLILTLLENPK